MKRFAVGIGAILFVRLCGAELVDIKFEVCDFDGIPVEGANIQFKVRRGQVVPLLRWIHDLHSVIHRIICLVTYAGREK